KRHIGKVVDFGLAKATAESPADRELTGTNQMMGTPGYTAPEQLRDAKSADIRADVYSLGCTLYCLLAGHPPFKGGSAYEVLMVQQTEAQPLSEVRPEVPAELSAVVARMMAKDPADRYPTPGEVARALVPFFKPGAKSAAAEAGSSGPRSATGDTFAPVDTSAG